MRLKVYICQTFYEIVLYNRQYKGKMIGNNYKINYLRDYIK